MGPRKTETVRERERERKREREHERDCNHGGVDMQECLHVSNYIYLFIHKSHLSIYP
jgi:hypothetical protein